MRAAVLSLCRRPVFAATAILTVALGIGANTALFGIVYSVLIRPLPFRDPGRLVQIWETHPALKQLQVTVPDFRDWEKQTRSFEQIAAYTLSAMNTATLLGQGDPAIVHATMAGSNLFPTMGIQPALGRAFNATEESGKQRVALISEKLWRRKFGAEPTIVGKQIRLDAESFQVVGVVPQKQAFPEWADLWIPLSLIEPELQNRRKFHPLEVVARLRPGVTVEEAQSEIQTAARRLSAAYPDTNHTVSAYVIPLDRQLTDSVRPSLLLVWAAVGLVLLIACANLAHLITARLIERRQEMAIREALGASWWHMIRQVLSESLLVSALGGAAGIACAAWVTEAVGKLAVHEIPRVERAGLDGPVLLFAIAMVVVAGVLFGLPACWEVTRRRTGLGESGRWIVRSRSRLSAVLMAGEVALALLVVSGAALLGRSFSVLLSEDPGFTAAQVWTIPSVPLNRDWEQAPVFVSTRVFPALRNVPGVVDVAAVNSAPMSLGSTEHSRFATRFGVEGKIYDSGSYPVAQNRWLTPEYFRVLGIPLRRGRWLTERDAGGPAIVVNETLARRYFAGGQAVGKRLLLGVMDGKQDRNEIVGVVGDVRDLGLDEEAQPTIYSVSTAPVATFLVKTRADANVSAAELGAAIARADPAIPVANVHLLEQNVSDSLARRRFTLMVLSAFGAMAAFLTAGGIYGLLTQSVNARVREFGVRSAVGAAPGELVAMILREALVLTLPGLAVGVALSLSFARVMQSMVYQLSPVDPWSIASAGLLLVVITFVSAWLPARRAAGVDPASALRAE